MKKHTKETKAVYDKPLLRQHGSVEKITKGDAIGLQLDANFPIGTPQNQLTFS